MNDILSPILAVFVSGLFNMSYLEIVNNMSKIQDDLNEETIFPAEADAFHCFSLFLSSMKQNYVKGFDGVKENLNKVEFLLAKSDKKLSAHFKANNIEIFHFGFRWMFCLLIREFPIHLGIKLMDYYLVEDFYPS